MTRNRRIQGEGVGLVASGQSAPTYEREQLSLARAIDGGRHAGIGGYAREAVERAWTTRFGIVVSREPAGIDTSDHPRLPSLRPCDARLYSGFQEAAVKATGDEYLELRRRIWLSNNDRAELFVADDEAGTPVFAAWLSHAVDRADITHPSDDTWIEAVYTFPQARRQGMMRAGLSELVRIAHARGASRVSAVVNDRNVPSLRGFAAVGFAPREVHAEVWRGWHRRFEARSLDATTLGKWHAAVQAPRD